MLHTREVEGLSGQHHLGSRKFTVTLRREGPPPPTAARRAQSGLKSGALWPTQRPHVTSRNEQRPLQAVLVSQLVTTWQFTHPTSVTAKASVWKHTPGVLSEKVSSAPFLHGPTEPVNSAANLDAPGQTRAHVWGGMSFKLSGGG